METPNQLKRKIEETQKSSSSQEASSASPSTLLLYPKNKLRPGQIAKYISKCFKTGDLDGLKNAFNSFRFTNDDLETFFSTEAGEAVLSMALVVHSNEERFSFFVKFVSLDVLRKALQKDNYELLRDFIGTESIKEHNETAAERMNRKQDNNIQIEKFKLLLEIDESGVEQAFRAYEPQEAITDRMKKNFEIALDARRKEKNIITSTNKTSGPSDVK